MKVDLNRSFELIDNGDGTQNLISKIYSNFKVISRKDLGDIDDIVYLKTQKQNLIKHLENKIEIELKDMIASSKEQAAYKTGRIYALKEILDFIKENNNENISGM